MNRIAHTTWIVSLKRILASPTNNGFVRTGAGFDNLAEFASPAAQTEGRYKACTYCAYQQIE